MWHATAIVGTCALAVTTIVTSILLFQASYDLTALPESLQTVTLRKIDRDNGRAVDEEWIPLLANSTIVHVEEFHSGLSYKYRVTFANGHRAMVKPVESISFFGHSRGSTDWNSRTSAGPQDEKSQKWDLSRADRRYQGWPEIAAYHLDRVLGLYRKPPIVGRTLTNKELFTYDTKLSTLFQASLPTYDIHCAVHAWVTGLQNQPPTAVYMRYLTHQRELNTKSWPTVKRALTISDAMVFDVLVDDHDRKWDFNWKATEEGVNLHWDSGLGWRHGPMGKDSCLDILCGTTKWIEAEEKEQCQRISMFRRETIELLREWAPRRNEEGEEERAWRGTRREDGGGSLSERWLHSLESDPLHPVFRFGLFWDGPTSDLLRQRITFETENFLQGLDFRVELLLSWVDQQVALYGESRVLLSEGGQGPLGDIL